MFWEQAWTWLLVALVVAGLVWLTHLTPDMDPDERAWAEEWCSEQPTLTC